MARQGTMKLSFFLLLVFLRNVVSICKVSLSPDVLRIRSADGPLIYEYKSDGTPVAHYPSNDLSCIFQTEDQRLQLTCPGFNSTMQFYQKVGNQLQVFNASSSSVYLLHNPSSTMSVRVHGGPGSFAILAGNYIKCSKIPVPRMHLISASNDLPTLKRYAIGYKLNDIDLLEVYRLDFYPSSEVKVVRCRIKSVIKNRPAFGNSNVYERGLFYRDLRINFTEIYTMSYQIASFQEFFRDVDLTEKYFAGNNSLVVGQLIFKEDLYYYSEQKITRFYENTAPIWDSVYKGNWRTIGRIIREMADVSTRDLEVFVTVFPSSVSHNSSSKLLPAPERWVLGNTTNSPDILSVPEILVKAVVDDENHARGIVYHTVNDPHLNITTINPRTFCIKTIDGEILHPEFNDALKGYTFCCRLEDSYFFMDFINRK